MSKLHRLPSAEITLDTVTIGWDGLRGHNLAVCDRCADFATTADPDDSWLLEWAETHRCDPEMAALLAQTIALIDERRAA